MFKRVEKKRKKREEEEELGLDDDMKEIMGFNDSDTDESDPNSESEQQTSDGEDVDAGHYEGDEEETGSEETDEQPPMPVHEALKNPVYLISLDPTVHGCILCNGKLLKNTEMAVLHKDATAHKRRFERFKVLASTADPDSDAWAIAKASQAQGAAVDQSKPEASSKRALKRQAKQVAIREKRKLHKQLKAKAMAKKASKKSSGDATTVEAAALTTKTSGSSLPVKRPAKRQKTRQQLTSDPPDKSQEASPKSFKRVEKTPRKNVSSKPHEGPKSVRRKHRQ